MKKLLLTTAVAAILVAPAYAQTTTQPVGDATQQPAEQMTGSAATDLTAQASSLNAQASSNITMMGGGEVSADELIGHRVHAPDPEATESSDLTVGIADAPDGWEDIGEIGDVIVDGSGGVSAVVIDAGGFLGMGEHHVRIPYSDLQFVADSDDEDDYYVVYTGNRDLLQDADEYDPATEETGMMSLRDHSAMSDDAAGGTGAMTTMPAETTMPSDADTNTTTDPAAMDDMERPDRDGLMAVDVATITADDVQGARVYGTEQDWIGDVNDVVLGDDGRVSQVVLDIGGWLGIGEHQVALGFDQVDLRRDGDGGAVYAYVDFTKEELEAMPEWEAQ
ncbi:PRC-barrel domain-containing protein [Pararhodobacter zhoushanensis]|uniref:PRC-barrel domain-containing protein n=1 Tax=Pararhodobacter zhoushanensis TaxID=2479545 RepID=A0ABT3H1V6_9RHOB|nr:PRC-barrel domain-containing protein [Pararhodobacter zhoushanensis]MCW1933675.1 PRC-barrel domain-containing protein [Pararhodobacter zhoushanensis]